jgi:hypothetical protein
MYFKEHDDYGLPPMIFLRQISPSV